MDVGSEWVQVMAWVGSEVGGEMEAERLLGPIPSQETAWASSLPSTHANHPTTSHRPRLPPLSLNQGLSNPRHPQACLPPQ